MTKQSFHFISGSGQPTKSGGILAAISSIVVIAASLVIGSFLLFFGLIVAVGLIIAFLIWRFFFFNKTKKKAEEFLRKNANMYGAQMGQSASDENGKGSVIDADFEDVSDRK